MNNNGNFYITKPETLKITLHFFNTTNIPTHLKIITTTYADDTYVLSGNNNPFIALLPKLSSLIY